MPQPSLIVGRQALIEAIQAGRSIDKIFFSRNVSGPSIGDIRRLAKEHRIPIQLVPPEKLRSLTRAAHQGVVAQGSLFSYLDLQQVIDQIVSTGIAPLFVLLDGITDVRNVGAIARTALCCGAQALVLPAKGMAALNEDALKTSAGALAILQLCRVGSMPAAIALLRLNGILVYASAMDGSRKVFELDYRLPCCLVFGSEDKGVHSGIRQSADSIARIPMTGSFNSFNVSVAAGIFLYEAMKQRG